RSPSNAPRVWNPGPGQGRPLASRPCGGSFAPSGAMPPAPTLPPAPVELLEPLLPPAALEVLEPRLLLVFQLGTSEPPEALEPPVPSLPDPPVPSLPGRPRSLGVPNASHVNRRAAANS